MSDFISISKVCELLGISLSTAYRWLKAGILIPAFFTVGGHRRFSKSVISELFKPQAPKPLNVVTYSRVSSADQKHDLQRQSEKLQEHSQTAYPGAILTHITDLGSGLNFKKKGLNQLLQMIWLGQIDILIINHKDRLLRFGSELIFELCKWCNVEVVIVEPSNAVTFEQELAQDVIELMTVFCARLYGKRSNKNKIKQSGPLLIS